MSTSIENFPGDNQSPLSHYAAVQAARVRILQRHASEAGVLRPRDAQLAQMEAIQETGEFPAVILPETKPELH